MRKQVGMIDDLLLAKVDARATALGQTRRVYIERALRHALESPAVTDVYPVIGSRSLETAAERDLRAQRRRHLATCKCGVCKPPKAA